MKTLRPIALGLLVIVLAGALAWSNTRRSKPPMPTTPTAVVDSGKTYPLTEIQKHADATSCWTTINGGVYDLTDWVGKHPGGREAILSICGKDGSGAFNAQHGGAQLQQEILKGYKVGTSPK